VVPDGQLHRLIDGELRHPRIPGFPGRTKYIRKNGPAVDIPDECPIMTTEFRGKSRGMEAAGIE
jgi:hypothetical protein